MAVYKRNNAWYCRGQINGERYDCKCDGATTEADAKAIDDGIRYKMRLVQSGLALEKEKDYSFSFLMEKYLEHCIANGNRTYHDSELLVQGLIKYFGARTKIRSIKPSNINSFKAYKLGQNRKPATINKYLALLKCAFNILKKDKLITYNPMDDVELLVVDDRRSRYLTKQEWDALKTTLPKWLLDITIVALHTGIRRSNVLRLRWEYIDLHRDNIAIPSEESKGKKIMNIAISEKLHNHLLTLEPKESGWVFINPKTGKPYCDVKKAFKKALQEAHIENFRFHDLRRTVGTWLLDEGVDIRTIQGILWHSDVRVTERYLSPLENQKSKAMNILDDLI